MTTIYAVEFGSVDPEEATAGGFFWDKDEAELASLVEQEKIAFNWDVDTSYLWYVLDYPGEVTPENVEAVTDWTEEMLFSEAVPLLRRDVVFGSERPGGEARRIEELRSGIDTRFRR